MEPNARYALVGVSLLLLVGAAVYFGFWLFGSGEREQTNKYTILFRDVSLSGLQEDSIITFRGIKAGRIESIEIVKDNIEIVRVIAQIKKSIPIKTDTRAIINYNLLTGGAGVDLIGSSQGSIELTNISPGEKYPVITQDTLGNHSWAKDLPEALRALTTTTREIGTLTKNFDSFLTSENKDALTNILKNISSVSADLAGKTGRFEKLLTQANEIVQNLNKGIDNLNSPDSPIGKAVINTADIVGREATNISGDIARLSRKLGLASQTLEDPRASLFNVDKNSVLGPGEKQP